MKGVLQPKCYLPALFVLRFVLILFISDTDTVPHVMMKIMCVVIGR